MIYEVNTLPDLPPGEYGFDIETTGLNVADDTLVAVGVSNGTHTWILRKNFESLRGFLESDKHMKIAHNAIFDMSLMAIQYGIIAKPVYDTLIVERILRAGTSIDCSLAGILARDVGEQKNTEVTLKFAEAVDRPLAVEEKKYLETDVKHLSAIKARQVAEIGEENLTQTALLELALLPQYIDMATWGIAFDAELWSQYSEWIYSRIDALSTMFFDITHKFSQVCPVCEGSGKLVLDDSAYDCPICRGCGISIVFFQDEPYSVDEDYYLEIAEDYKAYVDSLKSVEVSGIRKLYGLVRKRTSVALARLTILALNTEKYKDWVDKVLWINPNSHLQVKSLIYDYLGSNTYGIEDQLPDTRAETLEDYLLYGDNPSVLEFVEVLIDSRKWRKLAGWGYDKYVSAKTGLVHPHWIQVGPATGRGACSQPNMQNVTAPKAEEPNMRKLFPARSGYGLVVADYGQQEGRILAQASQDKNMLHAANQEDLYIGMAEAIYGTREVTRDQRQAAKMAFLGMAYGLGTGNLAKRLGITFDEALRIHNMFSSTFSKAMRWGDAQFTYARANGFTKTLCGRKRYFEGLTGTRFLPDTKEIKARNEARNAPIQGTGADIMKMALVSIWKDIQEQGLDAHIRQQVHDEIVVEARTDVLDRVAEIVSSRMTKHMEEVCPDVKCIVDISVGKGWEH